MAFTQEVTPARPNNTPVRSEPLKSKRPGGAVSIGITLIVFGVIGWATGARYTLFGWVIGLNLFFAWLGLPIMIPTPTGWWVLALIPVGVLYSRAELQIWKVRTARGEALARLLIGWLLIIATDVGSTYIGVRTPQPEAWPITMSIAASAFLSFAWAVILTFASDWLILLGYKLFRR